MMPRFETRALDYWIALGLAVVTVATLFVTQNMGFTRDESFYFHAAQEYAGWFRELGANLHAGSPGLSFSQENIDRHWSYNPEHPILVKTSFALSWLLFHEKLGWMSDAQAFRFPAFIFSAWLMVVLYLFSFRVWGSRRAALLAPALLLSMPRFFFHTHLACFDIPITTLWVVFIYAYWRSLRSSWWAVWAGAAWGIALITKLNAFFLPFVVLAHWGLLGLSQIRASRSSGKAVSQSGSVLLPPIPRAWFAMAILGPLIFVGGWPRHWFDTLERIGWYLRFHLRHEHYFVTYFGEALIRPPFPVDFPFVMTLVTTPIAHLLAFALGAWVLGREWWLRRQAQTPDTEGTALLLFLNILIPFLIIARPSTPVFGGVKHWFPALPFLCMVAARGLDELVESLSVRGSAWLKPAALGVLAACTVGVGVFETAKIHPYGTSYYSPLIGGITGAAERKMTRQVWGYASRGALPWLNRNAEPGTRVNFHDTAWGAFHMYQQEGLLRDDIQGTWSIRQSDIFLLDHDKAFEPEHYRMWDDFGTQAPVDTVTIRGVPVISIYQRLPELSADPQATDPAPEQGPTPEQDATPEPHSDSE